MNVSLKFYVFGKLDSEATFVSIDAARTALVDYVFCIDNLWVHKSKAGFFAKISFD